MTKAEREKLRKRLAHRFGHFPKFRQWEWWEPGVFTNTISEVERAVRQERKRWNDLIARGEQLRDLYDEAMIEKAKGQRR